MGGSERRAGGADPGQLTRPVPPAQPGRPGALRARRPGPREPRRADDAAHHPARAPPGDPRRAGSPGPLVGLGRGPGGLRRPPRRARLGPRRSSPRLLTPRGAGRGGPQHAQRALHRRRPRPGHLGGSRPARLHRRPGPGAGLRSGQLHRLRARRRARCTGVELDPVTAAIAAALYPDADDPSTSRSPTPAPRSGSFDLAIGNVPFGQVALHDRAPQPGRAQHPQPLHHQVPAPDPPRRPGRRADLPVHDGRPQPGRPPRDRRPGRPGRRGAAAQRRAPAGRGHRRGHRPADLAPPRARPRPGPHRPGSRPGRPTSTAPRCRSTSTSSTTRMPCSASWRAVHGAYSADDLIVTAAGDTDRGPGRAPWPASPTAPAPAAWPGPPAPERPGPSAAAAQPRSRHPDGYLEAHRDGTFTQVADGLARSRSRCRARQAAELRAAARGSATPSPACWTPRPPHRTTPPRLGRPAPASSTAATTATSAPTARSTGSPGGAPAAPTRPPARRSMARIRPPQGGFRCRPVRAAGLRAGGIRPGRPARRQGRHLHQPGRRAPHPAAGRRHPGRRAGDLPGHLRRGPAGRDRPAARHQRGPGPRRPRHPGLRRPADPAGWCPPPSTCPATSATSSAPPSAPPRTTPGSRSTPPNCAR